MRLKLRRLLRAGLALGLLGGMGACFPEMPILPDVLPAPGDVAPPGDTEPPAEDGGLDGAPPPDAGPIDFDLPDDGRPDVDLPRLDMDPVGRDMALPPVDMAPVEDMAPPVDMAPVEDMAPEDMAPEDMAPEDMAPEDMGPEEDMAPPLPDLGPPMPEVCNGIDDDQDGIVDNAPVCGRVISERCQVYLGWADNNNGPGDGSPDWGACPGETTDGFSFDDVACVGTRRDGRFRLMEMPAFADVDRNDQVGVAFLCDDSLPGVTDWIESSCAVWLGQADRNQAADAAVWDTWGSCFEAEGATADGNWTCVSSRGDGLFHKMQLQGGVGGDDAFAVAFRCHDPEQPVRAAQVTASAAVVFAWSQDGFGRPDDGAVSWGECPGERGLALDNDGQERCASSAFDGRFHRFQVAGNVDAFDAFGIALVPGPDAPPPPE